MRGLLFEQFNGPMSVESVADPELPKFGVVLKTLACGVCRSDWHAWSGNDKDVKLPHIPGHEFCGEVVAVDKNCKKWRIGDRVIAPFILGCGRCEDCIEGRSTICKQQDLPGFTRWGAFAEYIGITNADYNLVALPDKLRPIDAAALGCRFTTAYGALVLRGNLKANEWLAIHGCGGVGLSALMIGIAIGAKVIAIDIDDKKLNLAKQLGAHHVINSNDIQVDDNLYRFGNRIRSIIEQIIPDGVHVSIDALGIRQTIIGSIHSLRPFGRHVQIGMPVGDTVSTNIPLDLLYSRQLTLFGTRGLAATQFGGMLSFIYAHQLPIQKLVSDEISLGTVAEKITSMRDYPGWGVSVAVNFS